MSEISPRQERVRQRIEGLIAIASPALDLVLAVGNRVSRILGPPDHEQRPVRSATEPALLEPPAESRADAAGGGRA